MSSNAEKFEKYLRSAQHSAVHLEMRDSYNVDYEKGPFADWKAGNGRNPDADRSTWWRPWLDLVQGTVNRGVVMRRARIVSEPVSEYTRFLHSGTFTNVAAGEVVRWLPRRQASDIALPGNDFWVFDEKVVYWNHFSGEGASLGPEIWVDNPEAAKLCVDAFEAVWSRAIPHSEYKIR
ncbi:DUF6879 family protein [Streptomyces acidiscabies]|uniref:DUF6879 domain-containing protein n=1 Tax=Streptomyces acidiscabies TaxID=42234 RepID=A0AAP6BCH5_9ACTN|nr:DUF6879 family protein [Streptomyces acidiscabies]MBP5938503.1 hypothetical protein [Streptomyces sp. LBUM 1476]MBZ3909610.1 hypothetical protein [Streptomyces acidiscabies]MDX2962221.1 hypothetical protein [Streptomyces acidiscabies]MDX3019673.1 hypothetical protein [Streptomyces acidiscabies]MDX3792240.1 hypothetical protein [Streptomyces acidiscabies]